jgi:hypothetical protein
VAIEPTRLWSALSPEGFESVFPSLMNSVLSCATLTRPTQTKAAGRRPVPESVTSCDLGSYKLRSPNLSMMKRRDPRTHLEPGRNLVVD